MAFSLRDCKLVQNKRSDSHLTGDKIFKHWLPLQKGARNSPEFRGKIPGFPGFFAHKEKPGKSPEKPRVSGPSWLSRNSWKSQESLERKFPRFPGFSLCAKKPGASDQNDCWHILVFPWFRGFLESLEKPRENLPHVTLGSSLIAGLPRKAGKAKRRPSGS